MDFRRLESHGTLVLIAGLVVAILALGEWVWSWVSAAL